MGKASRHKQERHDRLGLGGAGHPQAIHCDDAEKISSSLLALIAPYIGDDMLLDELEFLVAAGAIAWNVAREPEAARAEDIEDIIAPLEDDVALLFESLIPQLVERKLALFPDDARVITGWDVRKKNGQPCVAVAAQLEMPARNVH